MVKKVRVQTGFELDRSEFRNIEQKYITILESLDAAGISDLLQTKVKVLHKEVHELLENLVAHGEFEMRSRVKETNIIITPQILTTVLNLPVIVEEDEWNREISREALKKIGYSGDMNKNLKKKFFPDEIKFLADILGKTLLCKTTAHDSISSKLFQAMVAVFFHKKINWGLYIFREMKSCLKKSHHGRILSKFLTSLDGNLFSDKKGILIHGGKKLTKKMFDNWSKVITPKVPKTNKAKDKVVDEPQFDRPSSPSSQSSPSLSASSSASFSHQRLHSINIGISRHSPTQIIQPADTSDEESIPPPSAKETTVPPPPIQEETITPPPSVQIQDETMIPPQSEFVQEEAILPLPSIHFQDEGFVPTPAADADVPSSSQVVHDLLSFDDFEPASHLSPHAHEQFFASHKKGQSTGQQEDIRSVFVQDAANTSSHFMAGLNDTVEAAVKRSLMKARKQYSDKLKTYTHMMRKELKILQENLQTMNNNQTEGFLMLNNKLKAAYDNTKASGTTVDELKDRVTGQEVIFNKFQVFKEQIFDEVKKRERNILNVIDGLRDESKENLSNATNDLKNFAIDLVIDEKDSIDFKFQDLRDTMFPSGPHKTQVTYQDFSSKDQQQYPYHTDGFHSVPAEAPSTIFECEMPQEAPPQYFHEPISQGGNSQEVMLSSMPAKLLLQKISDEDVEAYFIRLKPAIEFVNQHTFMMATRRFKKNYGVGFESSAHAAIGQTVWVKSAETVVATSSESSKRQ